METLFWIGAAGEPNDGGPGTDFNAFKIKWFQLHLFMVI